MLYNLLCWVYRRPGRRLKAGQLHEAGCICLLLREKMRLLLFGAQSWPEPLCLCCRGSFALFCPQCAGQGEQNGAKFSGIRAGSGFSPNLPKLVPSGHFPSCVSPQILSSQKCIRVAFCPFFSPSINIANAPVINTTERDSLEDVNIHQSLMICIWIQKIGLWLLTAFLLLWFPHALNAGGLNTWGFLCCKADFAVFIWK